MYEDAYIQLRLFRWNGDEYKMMLIIMMGEVSERS